MKNVFQIVQKFLCYYKLQSLHISKLFRSHLFLWRMLVFESCYNAESYVWSKISYLIWISLSLSTTFQATYVLSCNFQFAVLKSNDLVQWPNLVHVWNLLLNNICKKFISTKFKNTGKSKMEPRKYQYLYHTQANQIGRRSGSLYTV